MKTGYASPARKKPRRRAGAAAEHKARLLKALAHPDRVTIFEFVAEGEKSVAEITAFLGAKEANTSRHLAVLRNAGLVAARKEGLNVYYSNIMPCLLPALACAEQAICVMAAEQGEVAARLKREKV